MLIKLWYKLSLLLCVVRPLTRRKGADNLKEMLGPTWSLQTSRGERLFENRVYEDMSEVDAPSGLVSAAVQNPYFFSRVRSIVPHFHPNSFQYLMLETSVSPKERFPDESHTSLILFSDMTRSPHTLGY